MAPWFSITKLYQVYFTGTEADGDRCKVVTKNGVVIKTVGALKCSSCNALDFLSTLLESE
jgi:hypothetical protein